MKRNLKRKCNIVRQLLAGPMGSVMSDGDVQTTLRNRNSGIERRQFSKPFPAVNMARIRKEMAVPAFKADVFKGEKSEADE